MPTNGTHAISHQTTHIRLPASEEVAVQHRGKLFWGNLGREANHCQLSSAQEERPENVVWIFLNYPEPPTSGWADEIDALLQQQDETDEGVYITQALSQETADKAKSLLQHFPYNTSEPAISATAQGELDFDWRAENGAMLTISVGPDGDIAFAFTDGDSEHAGRERSVDISPDAVRFYLQRILR